MLMPTVLETADRRDEERVATPPAGLRWYAAIASAWVFVLVCLGAFTTSIGAGMAFPDWPLSNGSLNPLGWLDNLAMFAEHAHRLSAGLMTSLTLVLALWIHRVDRRPWLRRASRLAVGLVLAQAIVGGLRVLLEHHQVAMLDTSVGRLFAMLHACLAQIFVCNLLAVAWGCSQGWRERGRPVGARVRRLGRFCCALLLLQLAVAAMLRHSFAGLAIPTFPHSTPAGDWLPAAWNFRVGLNFTHRLLAGALGLSLAWFALAIWGDRRASLGMRCGASLMVGLVALQILLGAEIIWTMRAATMTTAHVLVGAFTLATVFSLTWLAHRDVVENASLPA